MSAGTPPTPTVPLMILALLALPALSWLIVGFVRLRGTTLRAPCGWSVLSLLAIVATEALIGQLQLARAATTARYLAATTTLCPLIGYQHFIPTMCARIAEAQDLLPYTTGGIVQLDDVKLTMSLPEGLTGRITAHIKRFNP